MVGVSNPIFAAQRMVTMNLEYNRNEDMMQQTLGEMRRRLEKIYEGGGKKAIEKQREKK